MQGGRGRKEWREGGREGEGGKNRGREGGRGRKEWRKGGREGGREREEGRGRKEWREGGREGEGGRNGEREGEGGRNGGRKGGGREEGEIAIFHAILAFQACMQLMRKKLLSHALHTVRGESGNTQLNTTVM